METSTVSAVDPTLVTVAAFKHIKGDEWKFGGPLWHIADVIVGPPPRSKLRPANDQQIHVALKAVYDNCKATDRKLPNVNEPELIKDYFASKGSPRAESVSGSLLAIRDTTASAQASGATLAAERRKASKTPPERS